MTPRKTRQLSFALAVLASATLAACAGMGGGTFAPDTAVTASGPVSAVPRGAMKSYFAIPYARSEYGFIIENMPITFVTLSNSSIELSNEKQIQGKVMNNASTIYEVSLPLEGKDLKALRTAEIDRIIVNWKSGTESFEVFDVDVLARQIQCMDRHVRK